MDVSDKVCPEQIGELLPGDGAAGVALIVTEVVPVEPVHPATVTFTLYVPALAVVTTNVGSSREDVKLLGPLQLYIALPIVFAVRDNVCPSQIGELFPAEGVAGIGLMVTAVVPALLVQPAAEVVVTE